MPFERHTWRAGEEPTIENMNRIEAGIVEAESAVTTESDTVNRKTIELTAPAVPRDGSTAMTGALAISDTGEGIRWDNNKRLYANATGLHIEAPSLLLPGGASTYTPKRMFAEGRTNSYIYNGENALTLVRVSGRAADGTIISAARSGGIPLDNPDGVAFYMMVLDMTINSGMVPSYSFYKQTAYIRHSAGQSSPTAQIGVDVTSGNMAQATITWAATLPSGGYIFPYVNASLPGEYGSMHAMCRLIVYRLM